MLQSNSLIKVFRSAVATVLTIIMVIAAIYLVCVSVVPFAHADELPETSLVSIEPEPMFCLDADMVLFETPAHSHACSYRFDNEQIAKEWTSSKADQLRQEHASEKEDYAVMSATITADGFAIGVVSEGWAVN